MNNLISKDNLQKTGIYCYKCFIEGNINNISETSFYCEKHFGRNFKIIKWCIKGKDWHIFYGAKENSKCQTCILTERNKTQKMIEVSKQNGFKYGSQNMKNLHKKYDSIKYCEKCKKETKCIIGIGCINCNYQKNSGIIFCEVCKKNTFHSLGFGCLRCQNKNMWKDEEYAFKISQNLGKYITPIKFEYCNKCNAKTPHNNKTQLCQVCNEEKIWCDKCQKFGSVLFHSQIGHEIFYKKKAKIWINQFPEQVEYLKENIIGFNNLIKHNSEFIIYGWFINKQSFYIGQSKNINSRVYDHLYEIQNSPEYWNSIINNLNEKNVLEIKILDKKCVNKEELNKSELFWINELKPISQKCNGTDSIKTLEEREKIKLY